MLVDAFPNVAKGVKNIPAVRNDRIDAKQTALDFGVPQEHIYQLSDSTLDEILATERLIREKIEQHGNRGEKVFLYIYVAGHGCSDAYQYLILNTTDPKKILYNVDEHARATSAIGKGHCFVFAVYDTCRSDASTFKNLQAESELNVEKPKEEVKLDQKDDLEEQPNGEVLRGVDSPKELLHNKVNYFKISGTTPFGSVPGDSKLAKEVQEFLANSSVQNNG